MSDLKPCKCGNSVKSELIFDLTGEICVGHSYFLKCDRCQLWCRANTEEELVTFWNTRPIEDALRAEVERLKAKNAKLMETQAVCECGGLVKDHVTFDGHYPIERKTECPNLTQLCIAKRRIAELELEVNRLTPKPKQPSTWTCTGKQPIVQFGAPFDEELK